MITHSPQRALCPRGAIVFQRLDECMKIQAIDFILPQVFNVADVLPCGYAPDETRLKDWVVARDKNLIIVPIAGWERHNP